MRGRTPAWGSEPPAPVCLHGLSSHGGAFAQLLTKLGPRRVVAVAEFPA